MHYRKDNPKGITAPNPDADRDIIQHITKHRGQKTPYTSVSEDSKSIRHIQGILYKVDSQDVQDDGHGFIFHSELIDQVRSVMQSSARADRVLATRAYQLATRAREALIDWQFELSGIAKKDKITWCYNHIQKYFDKE